MEKQEKALRELCIQIARGDIMSHQFNNLLLESGVFLDDEEWQATNKLLSKSDEYDSLNATMYLH